MDGSVSERLGRHYREVAAGEAALVMVEYAYVDDVAAKAAHGQLGVSSDEHVSGLAWLAELIRAEGPAAGVQLVHAGCQKHLRALPVKGPSAIAPPAFTDAKQTAPEALTKREIAEIVEAFGQSARRALLAGFDLVEVHAAHGYLITNFLSAHTNRRDDEYGGSPGNRLRFLSEVLERVRRELPAGFPLTVRLNGSDYEPGGIGIEDAVDAARLAQEIGVDAIHVSGGDHRTVRFMIAPMLIPHGPNLWAAAAIRREVAVPVIASGSFTEPAEAERALADGSADFVSLGRALLADPRWAAKARAGDGDLIRPCIRCNDGCFERTNLRFRAIACSVNPELGHQGEPRAMPAAGRRLAVVGGGPAGLEAARVAASRGHAVTLFERASLGGLLNQAAAPEFKADLRPYRDWLVAAAREAGVEIVRAEPAPETLASGFDVAVVATGSRPLAASFASGDRVRIARDMEPETLAHAAGVVVIGGGRIGTETAIRAAEAGAARVTLVERGPEIMRAEPFMDRALYPERVAEAGVELLTSTECERVDGSRVTLAGPAGRRVLDADHVLVAVGEAPESSLADVLRERGMEVHVAGTAAARGRLHDAVHSGNAVGARI
jgi:2,4-dienoyl-CoA reductase-like NADH-dependent reductase (Old Yellow Enzyme family)/thioredoxin reductase